MSADQSKSTLLPSNPEALLAHYQQMMELAGDVIYTTNAEGFCVYVNPSVKQVLGYTPEQMIGMHFSDLVHPDSRQQVVEFYRRQFSRLTSQSIYEFPVVTRAGETRSFEQVVTLIVEQGQAVGFHAHLRDMSQHKQIQDNLVETVDSLLMVVERANVALFVARDETITYANSALEVLAGYGENELSGKPLLDLVHPDDHQHMQKSLANPGLPGKPIKIVRLDGEERWIDLATNSTTFESQPAIIGTCYDITARIRAEADRKAYVDRLEIIRRVDAELTQRLEFNYVLEIALKAAVELTVADAGALHLAEKEGLWVAQVIGKYPKSVLGSRWPKDRGITGRVYRTQKAEIVMDVREDPDYVPNVSNTLAQMTVPLIAHNRLIGILNVQTAEPCLFSEQKFEFLMLLSARIASALENARLYSDTQAHLVEVEKLYQQVSALEQMKTQMIRVAAHDLRNPLGVISGYLQMLHWDLDATLNERSREHLHIIQQSAERIDKITRDILTLEKMEANQGLPNEQMDLSEIVTASYEEFRSQASEKSLDYQLNIAPGSILAQGDRNLLAETVGNLISNAIKYTPEKGQVKVLLKTEGKQIVFEVEDTGYGIPQEQQGNLFKPFQRVILKETRAIKGTGLGLHLVKSIVERHQGQMHFSSTYGKGSVFGFELPLAATPSVKARSRKNGVGAAR